MASLVIRQIESKDVMLLNKHFPAPYPAAHKLRIERQAEGVYAYILAEYDHNTAAICLIRWKGPLSAVARKLSSNPEIGSVFVLPAYRRLGIAKEILSHAEKMIKDKAFTRVGLAVLQSNVNAISLYEHIGYKYIGQIEPNRLNPSEPRFYYAKQL